MEKIKNKIKYFWKKAFVKDVAILQLGSIFSTGLSFVASVVFAQVLGANNYGIYSIVFAFTGLIGMFLDFGTGYASITLIAEAYAKDDKKEIKNILTYFIRVTIVVNLLIGGTALILSPYFTNLLYRSNPEIGVLAPQIGRYARLVLGAVIIRVMFSMMTIVMCATRKIKALTITENLNKIFYKFMPIAFVLMGMGVFGIVFGHFVSAAIFLVGSIIYYQYLTDKDKLLPTLGEIFYNKEKIEMWRYFKFGLQIAITKNQGVIFKALPLLFLARYTSTQAVGHFKLALSYITIPMLLISCVSRILNVQLPKSRVISRKLLKEHFVKTAVYSFLIGICLLAPFVVMAPILIKFFYGVEFIPSIRISYYLSFYVVIAMFFIGNGPIYRAIYKVKAAVIINGIVIFAGVPIIFWAIKNYGINGMIWTQILWVNIASIISFIFAIKFLDQEIAKENRKLAATV